MNRILLTGINGQLGSALQHRLASRDVVALDRSALDLSNPDAIRKVIHEIQPAWIINPAAYTAVDRAQSEPELSMAINATAPSIFAAEAAKIGAVLLHYSTDYVFEGTGTTPYLESDAPNPQNIYGSSKLAGEQAILASSASALIFRTSWVYNAAGKNFLRTILNLARQKSELNIVADQHGAPTSADDLAALTVHTIALLEAIASADGLSLALAAAPLKGIYHAAGAGETTWFGFATEFLRLAHLQNPQQSLAKLNPIPTSAYPTPAARPLNSRLDCAKISEVLGFKFPDWQESVAAVMDHIAVL